jgi:hypothetical protein
MKLSTTASAIEIISDYIEKVSKGLSRMAQPENEAVFLKVLIYCSS